MASAEKHVHFAKCFILYIFVIVLSTINLFEHKVLPYVQVGQENGRK